LQREDGELLSDFNIKFNFMYSRVPAEVRPTPLSAMITYAQAFDSQFYLLLRERRCTSLVDMQNAAFEVEANIIAAKALEGDAESRRQGGESSSSSEPEIDELARMIEFWVSEVSKLKDEQYFEEAGAHHSISFSTPNLYRGA